MNHQELSPIILDFTELLRYVGANKVEMTPKQGLVPLRHIKAMMEMFQVKEVHEEAVGDKIFKKRDELEYSRFYFLDLLAISGGFLKINRKNVLVKGPYWESYFSTHLSERGFLLFHAFRYGFDFDNWLLRGSDFGEQVCEKSEMIWFHLLLWRDGQSVDWRPWAENVIKSCKIRWNSIDQSFAIDLASWGLERCFVQALEYFGLVETERIGGEFKKLKSVRLNAVGRDYFNRILGHSGHFLEGISPFSLN